MSEKIKKFSKEITLCSNLLTGWRVIVCRSQVSIMIRDSGVEANLDLDPHEDTCIVGADFIVLDTL